VIVSSDIILALLGGALAGLGVLTLVLALRPARTGIAAGIARLDASRQPSGYSISDAILSSEGLSGWRVRMGAAIAGALEARGLRVQSLRSDLALLGRSLEGFLASTVLFAVGGLLFGPALIGIALLGGADFGVTVPVALALVFALLGATLPLAAVRRLNELRDLSAALTLVADDGAKIRASLAARAATLRRRELAEMEGKAGQRSQSMLVAQMLIVLGYLLFIAYPAVSRIL
jgi:tight adherence protein C